MSFRVPHSSNSEIAGRVANDVERFADSATL